MRPLWLVRGMRPQWLAVGAVVYGLGLAVVGLWETPVDRNVAVLQLRPVAWAVRVAELDPGTAYDVIEFSANIVLFVPLGLLLLLIWPRARWWHATLFSAVTAGTIEILQELYRPERFATVRDVVANTIGGALGALLVVIGRRLSRR